MNALDQLAHEYKLAKAEEQRATETRRALEEQILLLLPGKDEGSVSEKTESGTLTAIYKINRKVDSEKLQDCWNDLTENAQKCFKWSADISLTAMRALQTMDEQSYKLAAHFITATPAKPSLSIKS